MSLFRSFHISYFSTDLQMSFSYSSFNLSVFMRRVQWNLEVDLLHGIPVPYCLSCGFLILFSNVSSASFRAIPKSIKIIKYNHTLLLSFLSVFSSCFTFAVPMRLVSCVGYTPHAWDPRSLLSMLIGLLYFGLLERFCIDWRLYNDSDA